MKNIPMIQVVAMLQAKGHRIEYYVRKDGGILVRSIDGVRYPTGASGNAVARSMAGTAISQARSEQLKYATETRKRYRKRPRRKLPNLRKEYDRVKRIWKKHIKPKDGQPHPAGYFGWGRIEYAYEEYGYDEALRRIGEAEKYALGIAYTKNVEHLAMFVEDAGNKANSEELKQLARDIMSNAYLIKEEWILPAYQELYKLNAGLPINDVVANVRRVLHLA